MGVQEYVHPVLNEEITAASGHYVLTKEARLAFQGRQVFYLVGYAAFDTTCCGAGGCGYALVPGFVHAWKYKTDKNGQPVSQVEPIQEKSIQGPLERLIAKKERVQQVKFL